jgi:hypothetical protein
MSFFGVETLHLSRQTAQTGRLTEAMLDGVFWRALLDRSA